MTESTWVSDTSSNPAIPRRQDARSRLARLRVFALLGLLFLGSALGDSEDAVARFIDEAFRGAPPEVQALWLTGERKQLAARIMGHDYPALRVRYWLADGTSAWVLEEIGKTEPITAGFVVGPAGLEQVKVLVYRESRGGEVKYPFFTDQFSGATLTAEHKLDRNIDGITGATLSVDAMTRLSRLALYLHQQVATGETVVARR